MFYCHHFKWFEKFFQWTNSGEIYCPKIWVPHFIEIDPRVWLHRWKKHKQTYFVYLYVRGYRSSIQLVPYSKNSWTNLTLTQADHFALNSFVDEIEDEINKARILFFVIHLACSVCTNTYLWTVTNHLGHLST